MGIKYCVDRAQKLSSEYASRTPFFSESIHLGLFHISDMLMRRLSNLGTKGERNLSNPPVKCGWERVVRGSIPPASTILLGHTRWRTRGNERVNRNNHPIRAGDIIGTHNGTIYNADYLFWRFKLRRFAQVDSELLFRLAHNAVRDDRIDMERFRARLELCRGQITAVLASRLDPETILVLKGNKPLELRAHRRYRVVLYASDPAFLDAVLADERGWRELPVPAMSMVVFRHEDLMKFSREPLEFIAQAKRGKAP